jgi:hypothetical protein
MKYSSLGIATAIAALIALVAAQPAAADDVRCTGFLPPGVYDNVVVPESAFCSMENSVVRGNVKALSNSHLLVAGGNHIGGNVEGDKALQVQIFHFPAAQPNVINGNGVIVQDTFATIICGALLPSGNVIIVKNRGDFLEIGGGPLCEVAGGGNNVQRGNIWSSPGFVDT